MGEGHQTGAFGDQLVEIGQVQRSFLGVDPPFPDRDPGGLQPPPHPCVRLVVLGGGDDLVPVPPHGAEGSRQHVGVLRCGRPEMDLVGSDTHPGRQPLVGVLHGRGGIEREREGVVGLYLGVAVEVGQPVDDLAADVGSAGVLEVGPPLEAGVRESGELATGVLDVEGSQGCLRLGVDRHEFARSAYAPRRAAGM